MRYRIYFECMNHSLNFFITWQIILYQLWLSFCNRWLHKTKPVISDARNFWQQWYFWSYAHKSIILHLPIPQMGSISIVLWLRTSKCTATIFCFHTNGSIHLGNTSASLSGYQRFHSWYISWQRTAQFYSATIHTTGLATLLLYFQDIRRSSSICIMRIMNMQAELATFAA